MPFLLVYGSKALIPVEIGEPSLIFAHTTEKFNDEALATNLDMVKGNQEIALIRIARQKQRVKNYYNRRPVL